MKDSIKQAGRNTDGGDRDCPVVGNPDGTHQPNQP